MWQATLGGGGKAYTLDSTKPYSGSGSGLSGFYSSGYPPTPPKESQTPEDPAAGASRPGPGGAGAAAGDDYINSSISSSISSEDLMSSDMKPTPEALMGFPSFPYSTRKIQEGN